MCHGCHFCIGTATITSRACVTTQSPDAHGTGNIIALHPLSDPLGDHIRTGRIDCLKSGRTGQQISIDCEVFKDFRGWKET